MSPERLSGWTDNLIELHRKVGICCIAVDEAHCISGFFCFFFLKKVRNCVFFCFNGSVCVAALVTVKKTQKKKKNKQFSEESTK